MIPMGLPKLDIRRCHDLGGLDQKILRNNHGRLHLPPVQELLAPSALRKHLYQKPEFSTAMVQESPASFAMLFAASKPGRTCVMCAVCAERNKCQGDRPMSSVVVRKRRTPCPMCWLFKSLVGIQILLRCRLPSLPSSSSLRSHI
jgi:hypothetical protein